MKGMESTIEETSAVGGEPFDPDLMLCVLQPIKGAPGERANDLELASWVDDVPF